jgi:hypothetical protein
MIDSTLGSPEGPGVVPETILPEQFFRPSAALPPEKRLMLAVLEEALLDLRRSIGARTPRARPADEVDTWFAADDEGWPCSFLNVCQALGLDVSAVRTRVARWQRMALAKVVSLPLEGSDAGRHPADQAQNLARAG